MMGVPEHWDRGGGGGFDSLPPEGPLVAITRWSFVFMGSSVLDLSDQLGRDALKAGEWSRGGLFKLGWMTICAAVARGLFCTASPCQAVSGMRRAYCSNSVAAKNGRTGGLWGDETRAGEPAHHMCTPDAIRRMEMA